MLNSTKNIFPPGVDAIVILSRLPGGQQRDKGSIILLFVACGFLASMVLTLVYKLSLYVGT